MTATGERLLQSIGPRLDEIDAELASLGELRDKPAGIIRVTVDEHGFNPSRRQPTAAFTVLLETLRYPRPS